MPLKRLQIENPVRLKNFNFDFDTNIVRFYNGHTVFVTGVTGFIGKVFLEILLRKFLAIQTVYLLIRPNKNRSPECRLKDILNLPLYDRLKIENPKALDKIQVIHGDVSLLDLGLSENDKKALQENVTLVFHAAASVRFDDPIKKAVLLNTRGTLEIVKLCKNMPNLKCLTYVSTAYCNTDFDVITEQVYPEKSNWKYVLKSMEKIDESVLNLLTPL